MSNQKFHDDADNPALSTGSSEFKHTLRTHLDTQADSLDFNITSRLSAARQRALSEQTRSGRAFGLSWLTVAGGTVTAIVLVVLGINMTATLPESATPEIAGIDQTQVIEDLTLLSASEDLEFYQSVEFLEWMQLNAGNSG